MAEDLLDLFKAEAITNRELHDVYVGWYCPQ